MTEPYLDLLGWRRSVSGIYAAVRTAPGPSAGHELWRTQRDALMRDHPQSPLPASDPLRQSGLPYWPYRPDLRFELPLRPAPEPAELFLPTDHDGRTALALIGQVEVPAPVSGTLDVWWLGQYGGGVFLPVRDGTAGTTSYGGGRYLLDTPKSADLGPGRDGASLVIDFNFLYHPSCRYDPQWQCPLAPPGNRVAAPIEAGERL
jgi:uncharacterized protein (DUF1684 family)